MTLQKVNGGLIDPLALRLWFQPRRTISEVELNPELDIARWSGTSQLAKGSGAESVIKCSKRSPTEVGAQGITERVELRVVEKIKHFRAELNTVLLLQLPILGHRKVNVEKARLPHDSSAEIPELSGRW